MDMHTRGWSRPCPAFPPNAALRSGHGHPGGNKGEATTVHPLARFVTKEAIALLLNLKPEEIYRIGC